MSGCGDCCGGSGLMSPDEALARILAAAPRIEEQEILPLAEALGRVLATDQHSAVAVPSADNSAMDGYALRLADVGADRALPVGMRIVAGDAPGVLPAGVAARIFTGAPIPEGADAVVMQEECRVEGERVLLPERIQPGQHIRRAGQDIAPGARVVAAGTRLRAAHLGALASVGIARVPCVRRLRVALLSTGDELVEPGEPLGPGQIYNSNRYTLAAVLRELGVDVIDCGIVGDTLDETLRSLSAAAERADVVISSGGVSVGEEDHVKPALDRLGELALWKLAIKPGKPVAFGRIGTVPFMGLPGNPVSALLGCQLLLRPFLLRMQGVEDMAPEVQQVAAGFRHDRPQSRREYIRVRVEGEGSERRVVPFPNQSSGVLTSACWASGYAIIPEQSTIAEGDPVAYIPFSALR